MRVLLSGGVETSVNRLHELLLGISGKDLPPKHGLAKLGEQLRSSVDPRSPGASWTGAPRMLTSAIA